MTIEKAYAYDVQALNQIEQEVFANEPFALSQASFYYHVKKGLLYKAVLDGVIVGYILWLRRTASYRLYSLAIKPEYRGQNIASELISESLKTLDKKVFTLEVRKSNSKAIALYEKFGFQIKKELNSYYDNEDGWSMKLER